ncbi:hypothetical protein O3Q51_12200 [Cryomorphaceae bacterium 1068]|nr:hypothetical protein [Cryomorphaceae bacterium 1068]
MKTINQVLLVLLFVAFSSVGFAQSSTTLPESTVKVNNDTRFKYDEPEEDEDEDDGESTDIAEEIRYFKTTKRPLNPSTAKIYTGDSMWMPNRD